MSKIYGYCRISRKTQSIERQITNIKSEYPDAIIFQEAFTGTKIEGREKFERLCRVVKSGDTIVFDSVSRMSRNADEGFTQYMTFFNQGVNLVFLKESPINTEAYKAALDSKLESVNTGDDAADSLVNSIMDAVRSYMVRLAEKQIRLAFEQAEKEVTDLHERTKEGLREKKHHNEELKAMYPDTYMEHPEYRQIGQAVNGKRITKKSIAAKALIKRHSKDFGGSLSDPEVIKLAGIGRNAYYRYKAQLKQDETEA